MILAGEEFGDQHDLFDADGNVTETAAKRWTRWISPVSNSRSGGRFFSMCLGWCISVSVVRVLRQWAG
jgi:hypothetical protein